MKLLLDEMWSHVVAQQLRSRGYDVESVDERLDLRGLSDEELLSLAHEERRAIVTENVRDLRRIARRWREEGRTHSGVLYTPRGRFPRAGNRGVGRLIAVLEALAAEGVDQRNLERWLR